MKELRRKIAAYAPCCAQEEADRLLMLQYIDGFEDILRRDNAMAHFTASAWIVNSDRTRVVMVHHNLYNAWSWAGGHADGEAEQLSVALREAREETGLGTLIPVREDIFSLEILGVDGHVRRGAYVPAHLHLNVTYLLEAREDETLTVKPDENSAVRWMTLEEAVERSTEPAMRVIYEKLNGKLR